MRLADHFTHSGDALFRWRSYLPLVLLPVFALGVWDGARAPLAPAWRLAFEVAGLLVALAGLGFRAVTIATAPAGTSERSTVNPRASLLNTAGVYSIVRHPLYIANTLIALGLAIFPGSWALPLIVVFASMLHYERVAAREEQFLEASFGDAFRDYAARVPAIVPGPLRYVPPALPFRWRKVLGREFHALLVIGAGVLVLDAGGRGVRTGHIGSNSLWLGFFALTAAIYLVMWALKKTTRIFEPPRDSRDLAA